MAYYGIPPCYDKHLKVRVVPGAGRNGPDLRGEIGGTIRCQCVPGPGCEMGSERHARLRRLL